jgi:hypothetical protein
MVPEVTARLRPRSGWESQDLGIAMVRGRLGRLLWQWCVVMVPLWVLLAVLLRDHPWAFFWITWWLKPLYDRVPLFTLGRRLFGQETSLREVLRELPRLMFKGNWYFLTLGRLSFFRCFSLPVKILEGGKFSDYRRRVSVLLRHGDSTVMWVTLGWFLCSVFTVLGCWQLWDSLTVDPEASEDGPLFYRMFANSWRHADATLIWTLSVLHLAAMTLTEIFYVGAGFGLYLNSRSHLEGWDIEVSFRSLSARLKELAGPALVGLFALLLLTTPASAAQRVDRDRDWNSDEVAPRQSMKLNKQNVARETKVVKSDEAFKVHTEEYTVYDDVTGSSYDLGDFAWLGAIISFIGWGLLGLAIAALLWALYRHRHIFARGESKPEAPEDVKARVVMGMDVSPEALPQNIPDAAAACWRAGDIRGALRLLYAGSLHWMIERARLPIRESDTEGDCLRHSKQLTEPLQTQYFQALTQIWMGHAYGHRMPDASSMEQCINQWPFRK